MRGNPLYETGDLHQKGVTHRLDITRTGLPDASYDVVIAHHVLEHIDDDRAAMRELFRLVKPGGFGLFSVPIDPTRQHTYEDQAIATPELRFVHFGGRGPQALLRPRLRRPLDRTGLTVETFRLPPEREVEFGLLRNEWIYIARKP